MGGAFPLPSGMGNVPPQQKGAELNAAESLQLQRSCHHGKKPINRIRSRGRGRPWREVSVHSGLHVGGDGAPGQRWPRDICPQMLFPCPNGGKGCFYFKGCVEI